MWFFHVYLEAIFLLDGDSAGEKPALVYINPKSCTPIRSHVDHAYYRMTPQARCPRLICVVHYPPSFEPKLCRFHPPPPPGAGIIRLALLETESNTDVFLDHEACLLSRHARHYILQAHHQTRLIIENRSPILGSQHTDAFSLGS